MLVAGSANFPYVDIINYRESSTYAELEGLMGVADRELLEDDNTESFEALEMRLRTPVRPTVRPRVCSPLLREKHRLLNNLRTKDYMCLQTGLWIRIRPDP